jgi:hypothetical protein
MPAMPMQSEMLFATHTTSAPRSSRRSLRDVTVEWVLDALRVADEDGETQERAVQAAAKSGLLPAGDIREMRRAGWPV